MLTWILNTSLLLLPDSFKLLFYLFKTLQTFYFFKVLHFKTLQTFYFLKYSTSFNSSSMVLIHQTCRPKPTLGSESSLKWWKMLFYFMLKVLFSLEMLHFCCDLLVMYKNGLMRKIWLIQNLWRHSLDNKFTIHILPNISRSEGSQAMKFGHLMKYSVRNVFGKNHAESEVGRLVLDLFLFFKNILYKVKTIG